MSQMMISNKYEPTSGIQWTPEYSWTSDKIQKQASKCRPVNFLALEFWQLVSLFYFTWELKVVIKLHCTLSV